MVPKMTCTLDQWEDANSKCIPQLPFRQYTMYATLVSTVAWCSVLALTSNIFRLKFKGRDVYSLRLRYFLLGYVVAMTGISTAHRRHHVCTQTVVFVNFRGFGSTFPTHRCRSSFYSALACNFWGRQSPGEIDVSWVTPCSNPLSIGLALLDAISRCSPAFAIPHKLLFHLVFFVVTW